MAPFGTRVSPSAHHVALITANAFFGMGAIVGKLGLPATHPLMFAFVREVVAGLLLLILAVYGMAQRPSLSTSTAHNQRPKQITKIGQDHLHPQQHSSNHVAILIRQAMWGWKVHWKSFAVLGLVVFGNQAGFIVGIKLTDPVTASVWQPSQPIMTAAICMAWGMEPVRKVRVMGVLLAALGCVAMVLLKNATSATTLSGSQQDDVDTTVSPTVGDESTTLHDTTAVSNGESPIDAGRYLIGNLLFFSNCLCTSLYVILSKRMLATYPAVLVTAWSYNAAAVCMWVALFMAASWPGGSNNFFCPECEHAIWYLPPAALPALLYYILFASVASYGLITWANQFATGTLVMSYTVLQPVTTTLLTGESFITTT